MAMTQAEITERAAAILGDKFPGEDIKVSNHGPNRAVVYGEDGRVLYSAGEVVGGMGGIVIRPGAAPGGVWGGN